MSTKCHRCQTTGANRRRCTGCYTVYYCSKQCQRSDWDSHKIECQKYMIESSSTYKSKRTVIPKEYAPRKFDGCVNEEMKMNEASAANNFENAGDHASIMSEVYKKCHCCQTSGANIQICARCRSVYYCSRSCQRSDWVLHKKTCRETAIRSADHITPATVSLDGRMETVDAAPNPEVAKPIRFEIQGIRQSNAFMATPYIDTTGNATNGSTSVRKVKGYCMRCFKITCTMVCTKCEVAIYCSDACQKKDWPQHMKFCKKVNDARMPRKDSALTNDEKQIIKDMKARTKRFKESESRINSRSWNFSGPYERIHASLTPDMMTIYERPRGTFVQALQLARIRFPGWTAIYQFDNIPKENTMFSAAFQKRYLRNVLVAFVFMYHDHAMRHAIFLKDSRDNITHVEFYFDHLSDNPYPHFSYTDVAPGNYIIIQNPLMHQFMDGQVGLRINDPSEVTVCTNVYV